MQYTIQKGDNLSKIAKKFNTTVEDLAALNGIQNPNRIRAGDTLFIGAAQGNASYTAGGAPSPYDAFEQGLLGLIAPSYSPPDLSAAFSRAADSYRQALDSAYAREIASLEAQAKALASAYEQVRRKAFSNARLSAVGSNEALASLGLAGNLYGEPRSGESESSRIRQDVALRESLAEADRQEQAAKDAIAQKIVEAGYTRDAELARWLAELTIAQAEAEQKAAKDAHDAALSQYKAQTGLLRDLFDSAVAQRELDLKAEKQSAGSARSSKASSSKASPSKSSSSASGGAPASVLYDIIRRTLGGGGKAVQTAK